MRYNNEQEIRIPKLYIMIGLSGAGKSTIAKQLAEDENCVIISSDAIRGEICEGGVADQSKNEEVFKIYHKRIKQNLLAGKNVIADATNITIKSRKAIFETVREIECYIVAYIIPKKIEKCIIDNASNVRNNPVPEDVIYKQHSKFQIPFYEEGFNEIIIYKFTNDEINSNFITSCYHKMKGFDQKNPHHNMDLYNHSNFVKQNFVKIKNYLWSVYPEGAMLHDIGKLFTQKFDENGIAHYYNHENVGTYYLLSNLESVKLHRDYSYNEYLEILFLINYHMMPFDWHTKKSHMKWKEIFGENKYKLLMTFHMCDKMH
jgi:predicted kinase